MWVRTAQLPVKTLITLAVWLFAAEVVSGCSYDARGPDPSIENFFYTKLYFFLSLSVIAGIVGVYFLTSRKAVWMLLATIAVAIIVTPITIFLGVMHQDCGYFLSRAVKFDFFLFVVLLALQLASWVFQIRATKLNLR